MITHPEKVLFPDDGITKGELAAYYEAMAPLILPHITGRPVTMERFPNGIGEAGFLQKNVARAFPPWLKRIEVPKKGGTVNYPLADDTRSLMWMVNQNCITLHVWTSRLPDLWRPDICIFDLDPSIEDEDALREAALSVRDLLAELGLHSWVKTTGSKGFHIAVPLDARTRYDEVATFAHAVGRVLVERQPDVFTQEFSKADRGGRILIDTGRNNASATFASVYTVRSKPGAPVSAPCTWDEIEQGRVGPRTFTLRSMADRIADVGELWGDMRRRRRSLAPAVRRLARLTSAT